VTYDLTRLGSSRFEHLTQALAIGYLGHGVDIFGVGPDGGREATFRGEVNMDGKGTWSGYGVIQAKYKARLTGTSEDQAWFFEQLTAELDAWIDPKKKRYRNQPEYLVIASNVPLTSVAENGGLDRLRQFFERYRDLEETDKDGNVRKIGMPGFKDYAVWHAEYLDRLLENNGEVRRGYADLVLPGDVLSRLYEQVTESDERLAQAWVGHVVRALGKDTAVELGESGDSTNSPLLLAEVAVDLPAVFARPRSATPIDTVLRLLVERANQVLRPSLIPAERDRVVVLGGPGSGKSTVSRLLCQLYRVALVMEEAGGRVTQQTAERAYRIRTALNAADMPHPSLHRLPVRVVLSVFADAVSRTKDLTLLQHIVGLINLRGSDPITVSEAKRLLAAWPVLVVLDGMDEVASADNRHEVSSRIADFLSEMAALKADVFTVCTSRPIGFERDAEIDYQDLVLTPLTPKDATRYAKRLLGCRFSDNLDRQEETLARLDTASRSPDTARLMNTPLQVTILSLLLEQRRQAPASRFALFNSYYDIIYARECNKPKGIGDVLEAYRSQFDELHERCGLTIHTRAERAGEAESILPVDELESIARRILDEERHPEAERDALIERILHLAQQRLVLLVPRRHGLSFEVRSLAEFFAARSLMSGEDAADKLELLVPSAHWRHTWLLAAGYIFAQRRGLRDAVISRLRAADQSSATNRLVMPGAMLAIDALQDGFAANTPKFEQQLALSALRLVSGPIGDHITRLAHALAPFMERSTELNEAVWRELGALLADHSPGATRAFLAGLASSQSEAVAAYAVNRLAMYDERFGRSRRASAGEKDSALAAIRTALLDAQMEFLEDSFEADLNVVTGMSFDGNQSDKWLPAAREIIVEACQNDDTLRSKIRESLAGAIEHDDVGHHLGA
jgi:hypothetical protein